MTKKELDQAVKEKIRANQDRKNYQKLEEKLSQAYRKLEQARSFIYDGRFTATCPDDWTKLADDIDDLLDAITDLETKEKTIKPIKEQS